MPRFPVVLLCAALATVAACGKVNLPEPKTRSADFMPPMRWDERPEAPDWTNATLLALQREGAVLTSSLPADVEEFCPGYADAAPDKRRAFWAGLLSAVAKYESSNNPKADGGSGRWRGLLQIAPRTAENFGCDVSGKDGLYDGSANLACGVRIMADQVGRDGRIASEGSGGWLGMARDWLPLRNKDKRREIADWTRAQDYCRKP